MRNKINRTRKVAIVGITALFVSLAGVVQAIPITLRSHELAVALQSSHPSSRNKNSGGLTASILPVLVLTQTAGGQRSAGLANGRHGGGVTVVPLPAADQSAYLLSGLNAPLLPPAPLRSPLPPPIRVSGGSGTPAQNAAGVPDGGMTIAMLGGTFCGIALLREKLKA